MWNKIVARMVEHAMPSDIIDPAEEMIAAEAAEYGIRQTARVASIAGVILFVVIAALLYRLGPRQQTSPGLSDASKAGTQLGADNAKLGQANEDLQKMLDDMTKKRDTLQGKVTNLEGQVADLSRQLQAARRSGANGEKQAAAAPKKTLRPSERPSGPTKIRVGKQPLTTSTGSDGRTVRDPAERKEAVNAPDPLVEASPPTEPKPRPAASPPPEPAPQPAALVPTATLEPPPAKAQPPVAPAAVPAQQPKKAASQPIAPDPPSGR
jgi:cell division septum initiation protein DivIVA